MLSRWFPFLPCSLLVGAPLLHIAFPDLSGCYMSNNHRIIEESLAFVALRTKYFPLDLNWLY